MTLRQNKTITIHESVLYSAKGKSGVWEKC